MKGNDNLKKYLKRTEGISSRRVLMTALMALAVLVIGAVLVAGVCLKEQALTTDFTRKNIAPCIQYPFGTDWMGRDMFVRTVAGLSLSIRIGLLTAAVSAVMAFVLGLSAAVFGKFVDSAVRLLIDIVMGIPHMLLLILISFACGRGFWGVVCGIASDPRGGLAAEAESVCEDRGKAWKREILHRVFPYGTESCSAVYHGPGAHVSPCDPA